MSDKKIYLSSNIPNLWAGDYIEPRPRRTNDGKVLEFTRGALSIGMANLMAVSECFRENHGYGFHDYDFYQSYLSLNRKDKILFDNDFIILDDRLKWDSITTGYVYEVEIPYDIKKSENTWTTFEPIKIRKFVGFTTPYIFKSAGSTGIYLIPKIDISESIEYEKEIKKTVRQFKIQKQSNLLPSKKEFRSEVYEIRSKYAKYGWSDSWKDAQIRKPVMYFGTDQELTPGKFVSGYSCIHNFSIRERFSGGLKAYADMDWARYSAIENIIMNQQHADCFNAEVFFHDKLFHIFVSDTKFIKQVQNLKINIYSIDNQNFFLPDPQKKNPMFDQYTCGQSAKVIKKIETFTISDFIKKGNVFYNLSNNNFEKLRLNRSKNMNDFMQRAKLFSL